MKQETVYLTNQGIKSLTEEKNEIENLLSDTNQAMIIDDKEKQFLKERLVQLENMIENADELVVGNGEHEFVQLGSIVQLYDLVSDEILEYMLVDHLEANPIENKLSIQSPVGQNLLTKRVGDKITLTMGKEVLSFEIRSIR